MDGFKQRFIPGEKQSNGHGDNFPRKSVKGCSNRRVIGHFTPFRKVQCFRAGTKPPCSSGRVVVRKITTPPVQVQAKSPFFFKIFIVVLHQQNLSFFHTNGSRTENWTFFFLFFEVRDCRQQHRLPVGLGEPALSPMPVSNDRSGKKQLRATCCRPCSARCSPRCSIHS